MDLLTDLMVDLLADLLVDFWVDLGDLGGWRVASAGEDLMIDLNVTFTLSSLCKQGHTGCRAYPTSPSFKSDCRLFSSLLLSAPRMT